MRIVALLSFTKEHRADIAYPPKTLTIPDCELAPLPILAHKDLAIPTLFEENLNKDVVVVHVISILHSKHDRLEVSQGEGAAGSDL